MQAPVILRTLVFLTGLLAPAAAFAGILVSAPVDVIGNLSVTQFTSLGYATNTYKDWGNEPFIAVDPTNTNNILVSSFSFGTSRTTSGANVFYSTNGGASWTAQFSVPAPQNGIGIPNDWNFTYDSGGTLHGVTLGGCKNCNIYHGTSTNPTSLAAWSWTGGGARINNAASANQAD